MKKVIGALAALGLLLVVTPGFSGWFAEARVNRGLDQLASKAPYLRIVERHWTRGWFSSHQDLVLEVVSPKVEESAPGEAQADPAVPDADEHSGAQPAAVPPAEPLRFTVRNDVLHGPVLWDAGLGLARVRTHLVLTEAWREKLMSVFGTDEPWQISTRVAFTGGGNTTVSGKGRTIDMQKINPAQSGSIAWDDFSLSIAMGRNARSFTIDGEQPRVEFTQATGAQLVMSGIAVEGNGNRIVGELYESDVTFAADSLAVKGLQGQSFKVTGLRLEQDSDHSGDFMNYASRAGTGAVDSDQLRALQVELKETHFDLSLRHLHIPTLEKLVAAVNQSSASRPDTVEAMQQGMIAPLMEHGLELLQHEPELVVDRIGFATRAGAGWVKGSFKLVDLPEGDASFSMPMLMQHLEADIRIEADQALLENLPNGSTLLGIAVDQGFATREGKKLASRLQFGKGRLTINGKAQRVPGLGAPGAAPPTLPRDAGPGA